MKLLVFICAVFTILSCTKNQHTGFKTAPANQSIGISCGTITMTPPNNLYNSTNIKFEGNLPTDSTITNLVWSFTKNNAAILTSDSNPISHIFNGANEGPGDYTATLTFQKSNGNSCQLQQSFQILQNDVCVPPSGISGPTIGYVGEETSPFSINAEDCAESTVIWDMNSDGIPEYNTQTTDKIIHTYDQVGTYNITATVAANFNIEQTVLTQTIEIRNKACINPFTNTSVANGESIEFAKPANQCGNVSCEKTERVCNNGNFEGDATFTENPTTCSPSAECPASYKWEASEYGSCTGACNEVNGTRPITNYICKKTVSGNTTQVSDGECTTNIGAKPSGLTENCSVPVADQTLNCLSCGTTPHNGTVTKWATSSKCETACTSQTRICDNGTLPPFDSNYIYATADSCPVTTCPTTYIWQPSQFGACTGACEQAHGTKPITNYICKKTVNGGAQTIAADSECVAHIGAKPSGVTQSCNVPLADQTLNCASCGSTPHNGTVTRWAVNPTCGVQCTSEARVCKNGTLPPFDAGYSYTSANSCPITQCPPNYTYSWKVGKFGACSAIQCGTQGVQTRTVICTRNDGTAVADNYCSNKKPDTTKACSARECYDCKLPWGGQADHGSTVTTYQASNVACGLTCSSEQRKCNDGVLSGSFENKECSVDTCTSSDLKGSSCNAFMGTMISWKDSSTGQTCIGNLFGSLMVGDYLQVGGTHYTSNNIEPWDTATHRGSAKVVCGPTHNQYGILQFTVESGTCKSNPKEPNLITAPVVSSSVPSDCSPSPITQQPFGSGACAVYKQGSLGDMPLKGIFLQTGAKKYATLGDYTRSTEQNSSATQGKIFSSSILKITYGGETKELSSYCGDSTVAAPNNSTCSQSSTVVIGGVTFKMGVGARNTIDANGYIPEYIGGFKNTAKTKVWSQKTCGVVTLSSSLGYLPPPCP